MPGFQPKMPASQSQNAAMHAAAEGHGNLGIPKKVAEEYVAGAHGKSVKDLPKHARKKSRHARLEAAAQRAADSYRKGGAR